MQRALAVGIALALLGCGNAEDVRQVPASSLEDEVGDFLDSYRLAIETRDSVQLRTMYVSDGRFEWIEDGEVRYRSPDAVLAGLATLPADAVIRTEYDSMVVGRVGESGARVSTGFRTVVGEGQSAYEFGGMLSIVLEEDSTGWRIVGGHTSSSRQSNR